MPPNIQNLALDVCVESALWEGLGDEAALNALSERALRAALWHEDALRFQTAPLERVSIKPIPVNRKNMRQNKNMEQCAVSLLFTDDARMATLNGAFRGALRPTNVLSFPAAPNQPVPVGEAVPLGDIALAFETCAREAVEDGKTLSDHVCHLLVHGALHLLGFDHEDDEDAHLMEKLERAILGTLGICDPYGGDDGATQQMPARAFSSEVDTDSREENASKQRDRARF